MDAIRTRRLKEEMEERNEFQNVLLRIAVDISENEYRNKMLYYSGD